MHGPVDLSLRRGQSHFLLKASNQKYPDNNNTIDAISITEMSRGNSNEQATNDKQNTSGVLPRFKPAQDLKLIDDGDSNSPKN